MEKHHGEAQHRAGGQGFGGTGMDNPGMKQHRGEARGRVDGKGLGSTGKDSPGIKQRNGGARHPGLALEVATDMAGGQAPGGNGTGSAHGTGTGMAGDQAPGSTCMEQPDDTGLAGHNDLRDSEAEQPGDSTCLVDK